MELYHLLERTDLPVDVREKIREELLKNDKIVRQLRQNENKFRTLIQTIPDIVYSLDKHGIFTFINDAIKQFGYTPSDLMGKHFSEILHPDEVEKVSSAHVLKKFAGKKTGETESPKLFDERRTGNRKTSNLEVRFLSRMAGTKTGLVGTTTEINSSGLYDKSSEKKDKMFLGTIGVIRDITEYKKVKEELKKKEEKIEHLEKFLRVCATCRKVLEPHSDDSDPINWIQMEVYFHKKTDTTFSHGYCPICYEKAREDIKKYFSKKDKK